MMYATRKPCRSWLIIAAEVKAETDPTILLKLVEELNRAMAQQSVGTPNSVLEKNAPSRLSKTA
jgi:hypothetical protein